MAQCLAGQLVVCLICVLTNNQIKPAKHKNKSAPKLAGSEINRRSTWKGKLFYSSILAREDSALAQHTE